MMIFSHISQRGVIDRGEAGSIVCVCVCVCVLAKLTLWTSSSLLGRTGGQPKAIWLKISGERQRERESDREWERERDGRPKEPSVERAQMMSHEATVTWPRHWTPHVLSPMTTGQPSKYDSTNNNRLCTHTKHLYAIVCSDRVCVYNVLCFNVFLMVFCSCLKMTEWPKIVVVLSWRIMSEAFRVALSLSLSLTKQVNSTSFRPSFSRSNQLKLIRITYPGMTLLRGWREKHTEREREDMVKYERWLFWYMGNT